MKIGKDQFAQSTNTTLLPNNNLKINKGQKGELVNEGATQYIFSNFKTTGYGSATQFYGGTKLTYGSGVSNAILWNVMSGNDTVGESTLGGNSGNAFYLNNEQNLYVPDAFKKGPKLPGQIITNAVGKNTFSVVEIADLVGHRGVNMLSEQATHWSVDAYGEYTRAKDR